MGRYQVKTQRRTFEVSNAARLAELVKAGKLDRNDLIKDLPEGQWTLAGHHPDAAPLFDLEMEGLPAPLASLSTASGSSPLPPTTSPESAPLPQASPPSRDTPSRALWVKTRQSTVFVRDLEMLGRLCGIGVLQARDGVSEKREGPFSPLGSHPEFSALFGAETEQTSIAPRPLASAPPQTSGLLPPPAGEIEDLTALLASADGEEVEDLTSLVDSSDEEVVEDLTSLVDSSDEEVVEDLTSLVDSSDEEEVEDLTALVDSSDDEDAATPGPRSLETRDIVTDIIELNEGEIEYLADDEVGVDTQVRTFEGDLPHDVIALDPTDLEMIEDREVLSSDDDIIALEAGDIEDFEPLPKGTNAPCAPTWSSFREAMNTAARRLREAQASPERTWDLFRGMMERSLPDGPGESTWNHFRAKVRQRHIEMSQPRGSEDTWDRFRALMMEDPTQEKLQSPWEQFVRSIRTRENAVSERNQRSPRRARIARHWPIERLSVGRAIVGEARVRSVVVKRSDIRRTSMSINNLPAVPSPVKD